MKTSNLKKKLDAYSRTVSILDNSCCMDVSGSQFLFFSNYKYVESSHVAWRNKLDEFGELTKTHNVLTNLINGCLQCLHYNIII